MCMSASATVIRYLLQVNWTLVNKQMGASFSKISGVLGVLSPLHSEGFRLTAFPFQETALPIRL